MRNNPVRRLVLLWCVETAVDYKDLYEQSTVEIASLKQELNNLKRLIYGSKNERFTPANGSSSQLSLDMQFDTVAQCNVIKAQKIEYIRNATEGYKTAFVRLLSAEKITCFAGSHEAAGRTAMLYSFLETCKLNGNNPFTWLQDVLRRISNHPINKTEELLPHNCKPLL
jgi:hypothetical protein